MLYDQKVGSVDSPYIGSVDSPYPLKSVQNAMATCDQQYRF